jgi:glycosyltransferase involved in cell wall biosynthesis
MPAKQVNSVRPSVNLVAILMCTKEGAAFLDQQLKSIAEQSHKNWILMASDDDSNDGTLAQLKLFAEAYHCKVTIRRGPDNGACANFLSLANDPTIDADYFAFSDQDDVWHADKLQRALAWLAQVPADVPGMYCGRTELMSMDGHLYGLSPLFTRPPAFQNALVQNVGGGNTMVFNRAAKQVLERAAAIDVALHDWWVYQLVSGSGGVVYFDPLPMVKYRQHQDNLIGSNASWRERFVRIRMMLTGHFRDWNGRNIAALQRLPAHLLLSKNQATLELFAKARAGPLPKRLYHFKRSGVYRQTFLGNLGLVAAVVLRRL